VMKWPPVQEPGRLAQLGRAVHDASR
jgi:hypothetical protein